MANALKVLKDVCQKRDELREALAAESKRCDDILRSERAKREAEVERVKALRQQMEDLDATIKREKTARLLAETKIGELSADLTSAQEESRCQREMNEAHVRSLEEATNATDACESTIAVLEERLQEAARVTTKAQAAEEIAHLEVAEANAKNQKLIDDANMWRQDCGLARNEADFLKKQAFRDCEALRQEVQQRVIERDNLLAQAQKDAEAAKLSSDRVSDLELEAQRMRKVALEREALHQGSLVDREKAEQASRKSDTEALRRMEKLRFEESKVLALALAEVDQLGEACQSMRSEVAKLALDNQTYAAQLAAYEETLSCHHELRATLDAVTSLGGLLHSLREDTVEQLALQSEQQRLIDIAADRLSPTPDGVLGQLDVAVALGDHLAPLADAAAVAMHELPLTREELLQASLNRTSAISALAQTQDAAEHERQKHLAGMASLSKAFEEAREKAEFTSNLQSDKLDHCMRELTEVNEELRNWRNGNIRLSNMKQWREEREREKLSTPPCSDAGSSSASPPASRAPLPTAESSRVPPPCSSADGSDVPWHGPS